jgi:hypothetical protein
MNSEVTVKIEGTGRRWSAEMYETDQYDATVKFVSLQAQNAAGAKIEAIRRLRLPVSARDFDRDDVGYGGKGDPIVFYVSFHKSESKPQRATSVKRSLNRRNTGHAKVSRNPSLGDYASHFASRAAGAARREAVVSPERALATLAKEHGFSLVKKNTACTCQKNPAKHKSSKSILGHTVTRTATGWKVDAYGKHFASEAALKSWLKGHIARER